MIEPVPDLLQLSGSLHKFAFKGKSLDEIIKIEEEVAAEVIADRYRKK